MTPLHRGPVAPHGGRRELAAVLVLAFALTALFTYPIAFRPGHVGRVDNGDGQLSIWNVTWVARTLAVDPLHVFDANIFYPHRGTLAYSENNLGAGVLAMPVYWATRNPYAAHNSVVLLAFALAFVGAYYLVRYLTGDWRAAAVAAVWFAFCPYTFARTAHIQLLMTAGLPFAMLAFHRLADRPSSGRGAMLGGIMAAEALCCGYYGIHLIVMIGFASVVVASTRSLWADARYWRAMLVAAAASIVLVLPAFVPYLLLQRHTGFGRTLAEAARYSANWSAWFASSSYAHAWLLTYLPPWKDALFPGVLVTGFAIAGLFVARRQGKGEVALLYGGLAAFAVWLSFGPQARLYSTLYYALPIFRWLRAPSRFGLIVVFSLSVLGSFAVAELCRRAPRPTLAFAMLFLVSCAELLVPLNMPDVPPVEAVYLTLTALPPGPVIEMPFFYLDFMFPRHTYYMLQSTTHWMPLVNGYSDYMPGDFLANVMTLAPFPSRESLKMLHHRRVRYAVFHRYWYNDENWHDVTMRLREFDPYLRMIYKDEGTRLYEIVGAPR
jgi:hypothetical protein